MVDSGEYSWNSGMFVWQVSRFLKELELKCRIFYVQLMEVKAALGVPEYQAAIERVWPQVKQRDHRIMASWKAQAMWLSYG